MMVVMVIRRTTMIDSPTIDLGCTKFTVRSHGNGRRQRGQKCEEVWGGWAGGWVGRGSDGRQTCGAEVVIVVLMVFQEGEGLV